MMRSAFAAIVLVIIAVVVSALGHIEEPPPVSPPPAVIGPDAVLLRKPHCNRSWSFGATVAFSPDGETVAVGRLESGHDGVDTGAVVSLIDTASGRERATIRGESFEGCSVTFSPDGRNLAVGLERSINLHDPVTGACREEVTGGEAYGTLDLAFSPDGRRIAAVTDMGDLEVWDLASHRRVMTQSLRTMSAEGVAISPDGRLVATASRGPSFCRTSIFPLFGGSVSCGYGPGVVRVFDLASGQKRAEWKPGPTPRSVAFSPDGKTLASGGGVAKLWDLATGRGQTIVDPEGTLSVHCVEFSPDGRTLAVGVGSQDFRGEAGEVHLWDIAGRRVRAILRGGAGRILALAFAPDGKSLVTASPSATLLWPVATGANGSSGDAPGRIR